MSDSLESERRQALAQFRRDLILDAARAVFAEHGIAGASLRKIAQAAGATTGGIYSHYESRQALYADVLWDSMAALTERLEAARDAAPPGARLAVVLETVFAFYRERPNDFDLSFYLFGGGGPGSLGKDLDRRLNDQMRGVIELVAEVMAAEGYAPEAEAFPRAVATMAHLFGLVLMFKTGRLKALKQDPRALLAIHIRDLERARSGQGED